MPGTDPKAKVLLKARPTESQLADRLASPVPGGLELYLDAMDLADQEEMARLAARLVELRPSPEFTYIVEGPLMSLDGSFFDLSVPSAANLELLRRLAWMGEQIGAVAALIHAIAPMPLETPLGDSLRVRKLEESLPLVAHYCQVAQGAGLSPMLENIPPVARQRQSAFMVTPIGMRARDLVWFCRRFPGLMATVDLSHAGLFLGGAKMSSAEVDPKLSPLVQYLSALEDDRTMEGYLREVGPHLLSVHVSNARGLLDEGLPYSEGDLELDYLAARLNPSVRYLVTETIEPDADRALRMREAQARLEAVLAERRV